MLEELITLRSSITSIGFLSSICPRWVGLQETRINVIENIYGFHNMGFAFSPSKDLAGDIICCWNFAYFRELSILLLTTQDGSS